MRGNARRIPKLERPSKGFLSPCGVVQKKSIICSDFFFRVSLITGPLNFADPYARSRSVPRNILAVDISVQIDTFY